MKITVHHCQVFPFLLPLCKKRENTLIHMSPLWTVENSFYIRPWESPSLWCGACKWLFPGIIKLSAAPGRSCSACASTSASRTPLSFHRHSELHATFTWLLASCVRPMTLGRTAWKWMFAQRRNLCCCCQANTQFRGLWFFLLWDRGSVFVQSSA